MRTPGRIDRLTSALRRTQTDLTVVLENIHDPHNVSAILRTCDAVGVRRIDLLYTLEHFPKIGKKSSASALKWVESRKFKSISECYARLREEGFIVAASVVEQRSKSLYELDLVKKVAFVFGNEHRGVSAEASAAADLLFQIPMLGMVQSLNVSVACAVTLFEASRQRREVGLYDKSNLSDAQFHGILDEWLKK